MIVPVLLLWVTSVAADNVQSDVNVTERDVLKRLLDSKVYDPTIRPGNVEEATRVEIDMALSSVGPVNDIEMELSVSIILRQEWQDERLKFEEFNHSLVISYKRLSALWVPDLYFTQSREENLHVVTTPNIMIRLSPDGSVLYTQRLSMVLQCPMNLRKFPMDEQSCRIAMESYSFTSESLYFVWSGRRQATSLQPSANIPDFTIKEITAEDCSSSYAVGNYSCLQAILHLKREIGFYATQTYIPSILIVVLSWASFWIDHQAVPARISVGLLTVLTITTQSSGAREQLPRVPYIKSIDVWMSACLFFVFAAYMEFAVVMVLSRVYRKNKVKVVQKMIFAVIKEVKVKECEGEESKDMTIKKYFIDPRQIDKISRSSFPLTFIIFNIVYWIYYSYCTSEELFN